MTVTDLLDTIILEVNKRRDELKPLVAEYELLVGAAEALDSGEAVSARGRGYRGDDRPRGAFEPMSSAHKQTALTRRPVGRPVGTGRRPGEALAAITQRPGITLPELAKAIDAHLSYVYTVVQQLIVAGKVVRDRKRYWPALTDYGYEIPGGPAVRWRS
jgi:hypothetical protein